MTSDEQKNGQKSGQMTVQKVAEKQQDDGRSGSGLRHALTNRHIQVIALGGTLGTGIYYGSTDSIRLAGPSVLLAYVLGAAALFVVVRALAEMATQDPMPGAFATYAAKYWGRRAGFVSGWNYWMNYIMICMVQLAVIGSFVRYLLPDVQDWQAALGTVILVAVVNLVGVRFFGEAEFWLSIIKVTAAVAMIVGGLVAVILALPDASGVRASFSHLVDDGGFFPLGLFSVSPHGGAQGLFSSFVVVMFGFGGLELVALTAGEAQEPEKTIPKASNAVMAEVTALYIGSMAVILAVIPWRRVGKPGPDGNVISPFVQIFDSLGFRFAALLLDIVCLIAVLSVYNSGIYSNSRMLHTLARQGSAPRWLGRTAKNGVPVRAVIVSCVMTGLTVLLVWAMPDGAFTTLMSISMDAAFANWVMILITEILFRRKWTAAHPGEKLICPVPAARLSRAFAFAFFGFCYVLMWFMPGYRLAAVLLPIWIGVLCLAAWVHTRRDRLEAVPEAVAGEIDDQTGEQEQTAGSMAGQAHKQQAVGKQAVKKTAD
jgi:AAT family amino acid transporter